MMGSKADMISAKIDPVSRQKIFEEFVNKCDDRQKGQPWNGFQSEIVARDCVTGKETNHDPRITAAIMADKTRPAGKQTVQKNHEKFNPWATESCEIGAMHKRACSDQRTKMKAKWDKSSTSCPETLYAQKYVESKGHNPYMDKNTR